MTEVTIGGRQVKLYNDVGINLKFDAIASTFSIKCYFDPDNARDKATFRPFSYQTITVKYGGVLVLTGTVLSHRFGSAGDPPKQWVAISGYSITGILEDSTVGVYQSAADAIPNQYNGLTLQQITEQLCGRFPLKVIVDSELAQDENFKTPIPEINIKPDTYIGDFLNDLCKHKNVVLSHDRSGNVVLTRAKTTKIVTTSSSFVKAPPTGGEGQAYGLARTTLHPSAHCSCTYVESTSSTSKNRPILYNFTAPSKGVEMSLNCDGQKMHRAIQVLGQQDEGNAIDEVIINPYVAGTNNTGFRPWLRFRKVIQNMGTERDTVTTARSILGSELKNITLNIEVPGWTLGGNLIMPNQLVVVKNKDVYCYNETKWFIQAVTLNMNENKTWAVLSCASPYCFNNETPKNIFK